MTSKYHILAVDDNPVNLKLLEKVLMSEGFEVSLAESGAECLQAISLLNPDLVILDVMMPEMDGFEICERLKADPATSEIPVVFVTALNDRVDILKGFEVGGVEFIPKPIDQAIVLARVKALLTTQSLVRDKENLLKVNSALLKRLENMLEEVSLQTKLSTIKRDVGEASELIYSQLETLRSKINEDEALSFLDSIEMSLQFGDRLSQQLNEIAKIVHRLHHLIQAEDGKELPSERESSESVLMAKTDQKQIDNLLESLGL